MFSKIIEEIFIFITSMIISRASKILNIVEFVVKFGIMENYVILCLKRILIGFFNLVTSINLFLLLDSHIDGTLI